MLASSMARSAPSSIDSFDASTSSFRRHSLRRARAREFAAIATIKAWRPVMSDTAHPSTSRGGGPADAPDAKDEELPRVERERDQLVSLLGGRALAAMDPERAEDARFIEWWARELRERAQGPALVADADAFERRLRAAIAARDH